MEAVHLDSAALRVRRQMQHLRNLVLSENSRYQSLELASDQVHPRSSPQASSDGLDGWSFMMRTNDAQFALLYFEHSAVAAEIAGFVAEKSYRWDLVRPSQRSPAYHRERNCGCKRPRPPNSALSG